jgi:predicted kinase
LSESGSSDASSLPLLVIVSGSPASGKSSLAEEIAAELNLPLLSRDDIKEALMDVYPAEDRKESKVAGAAAFKAMYQVLGSMLQVGVGVVLESTFEKGRSENDLSQFFDRSIPVQVTCKASTDVLKERLAERIRTGSRHPGHQDEAAYIEVEEAMARGDYDPLDLDVPCIEVNSDDGFKPAVHEIVARIGEIQTR